VLGEIDTCVGELGVPGRTHMRTADPSQVALRGRVVVDASDDGGAWLRKLQQSVRTGAVTEAIASVPSIQSPACLRALRNGDWTFCIRPDCVLVYKGPRSWAFKVAMEPLGLELAARRGAGPQDRERWRRGQIPPKFPLTTSDRV
ncbi:MAG: hypothetical protein K8J09_15225, partial [Planctomycetes bacterium]|nr:hypothetical protein [Planctomycetota bacterium]